MNTHVCDILLLTYTKQKDKACSLDNWRRPLSPSPASPSTPKPIVALGKFDALHRGHQALAIAAANLGGHPWLVSFAGMAEVLQWPPRLPLVALQDRPRVMSTWQHSCGGITPKECAIPFADVRSLSPEEFVDLLANVLQVGGVCVGSNYRFGYKAAGDVGVLKELGEKYGLKIGVVDLVEHEGELEGEVVSSSRVREALAAGDVETAAYCLGRPYRLVMEQNTHEIKKSGDEGENNNVSVLSNNGSVVYVRRELFANQPPAIGQYTALAHIVGGGEALKQVHALDGRDIVDVRVSEQGVEILYTRVAPEVSALLSSNSNGPNSTIRIALDFL